jgi:hypothetical protein
MTLRNNDSIRATWRSKDKIGYLGAVRRIASITNERGIALAERRAIPVYWFVGTMLGGLLLAVVSSVLTGTGTIGNVMGLVLTIVGMAFLFISWPLTGLVIYWDTKAIERIQGSRFLGGNVIAGLSVFIGQGGVVLYYLYQYGVVRVKQEMRR